MEIKGGGRLTAHGFVTTIKPESRKRISNFSIDGGGISFGSLSSHIIVCDRCVGLENDADRHASVQTGRANETRSWTPVWHRLHERGTISTADS